MQKEKKIYIYAYIYKEDGYKGFATNKLVLPAIQDECISLEHLPSQEKQQSSVSTVYSSQKVL